LSTVNNQPSTAFLEQNIPNPFSNSTTINYTLPQQYSSAQIIITDKNGSVLKQINLNTKGKGSVTIKASILSSGAYQYSLIIDGKIIASKQMEIIR
jgi:flagellar hook assembly protein FlgD